MKKIDILIYSRDRAAQLDLLLKSVKDKFKNSNDVFILYTTSTRDYELGYQKLFANSGQYGLQIKEVPQIDFFFDVKSIISMMSTPYMLGLCDDDVFIKEINVSNMLPELEHSNVNAISLKSGLNITHHYPNIKVDLPTNFIQIEPYLKWNWATQPRPTDWGYPTCINSFIFERKYYLSLLSEITFTTPTTIEANFNTIRHKFRPIMVGTKELKLLNIPCNRLQTLNDTPYDITNYCYTVNELNSKWLQNYCIDTKTMYTIETDRPNLDVKFKFVKEHR